MTAKIDRCQGCGKPFEGPRYKVAMMREVPTGFATAGFSRYYCEKCAMWMCTWMERGERAL